MVLLLLNIFSAIPYNHPDFINLSTTYQSSQGNAYLCKYINTYTYLLLAYVTQGMCAMKNFRRLVTIALTANSPRTQLQRIISYCCQLPLCLHSKQRRTSFVHFQAVYFENLKLTHMYILKYDHLFV